MTAELPQRQILTISQLNRRARQLLEIHLPLLWIRGEISNFAAPGSGHWYFTLKDSDAQIRCAMFRNRNNRVTTRPKNGDQVLVRGRVGLYEARGEYQLIVEHLEADGAGLLQQRFDALKEKLLEEGLFDNQRKRALPPFPTRIGLITSPTGAAVRDILHVLKRRCPWVEVVVFPSAVQGAEAVPQLVQALERANRWGDCDLLVIGRGGGSIEDLWAFNEEAVARAIAASRLPVISAVGHETDFTIADFVADVRAPTPSAAAEIAAPDADSLRQRIAQQRRHLVRQLANLRQGWQRQLTALAKRLRSPGDQLREQTQQLDHLEIRLQRAVSRELGQGASRLVLLRQRLYTIHPEKQLRAHRQQVAALDSRLGRAQQAALTAARQRLSALAGTLNAVSPLSTLERGYAIALNDKRQVVQSVGAVAAGDGLDIRVTDGTIACRVTGTEALDRGSQEP